MYAYSVTGACSGTNGGGDTQQQDDAQPVFAGRTESLLMISDPGAFPSPILLQQQQGQHSALKRVDEGVPAVQSWDLRAIM